jgi:hypothetical protein
MVICPDHSVNGIDLLIALISNRERITYCHGKNKIADNGTALKSDSTHHFFRNACTKSGSLRFSQFSGC